MCLAFIVYLPLALVGLGCFGVGAFRLYIALTRGPVQGVGEAAVLLVAGLVIVALCDIGRRVWSLQEKQWEFEVRQKELLDLMLPEESTPLDDRTEQTPTSPQRVAGGST